jgi:putative oxidoreductase
MGEDLGKFLLRVTVGGLMLFHGVAKLSHGIGFISGMVEQHHLPSALAYGVYVGEVLGPLLLILGLFARAGGLFVALDMVIAVALTRGEHLLATNPQSGGLGIELELLYLVGGLAVALFGAGSWSVSGGKGLWN